MRYSIIWRKRVDVEGVCEVDLGGLPAGSVVAVSVPLCPTCGFHSGICRPSGCDFDWDDWARVDEKFWSTRGEATPRQVLENIEKRWND